jgi:hypothetical protein
MAGPFFFAWVEEGGTAFDEEIHCVEDEDVFSFEIEHAEGDFPSLSIEVKNPRIGLLASGRKRWCWLSWRDPASSHVYPLFHGRLVGVPERMTDEIVSLSFLARPHDYNAQRLALAATMRVTPYWDYAWIDESRWTDLDALLEARSELWHVDRLTHVVTTSDVLVGEDTTFAFGADDLFYDGMNISYGEAPLRTVAMTATAQWSQFGSGTVDYTQSLRNAFSAAGAPHYGLAASYSGDGLIQDWPKPGDSIGGGWKVASGSFVTRVDGYWFPTLYQKRSFLVQESDPVTGLALSDTTYTAWYPLWEFSFSFQGQYEATRKRKDILYFELKSDIQSIVTETDDDDVLPMSAQSRDLSQPISGTIVERLPGEEVPPGLPSDAIRISADRWLIDGDLPIGNVGRRAYFPTERGQQSIDYLIMLARAKLLMRSRAVNIEFETTFINAVTFSCRCNATVYDPRLPGGEATGKIVSYSMSASGSGLLGAKVTIGSAIGYGTAVVIVTGTPTYVEIGYCDDYQCMLGTTVPVATGDVTYVLPDTLPNDDGIDFSNMNVGTTLRSVAVYKGPTAQAAAIAALTNVVEEYENVLANNYTEVEIVLLPISGSEYVTEYDLETSTLVIPKMIDMEAA